ncbi:hypothetical protein MRX96_026223 [Rhipicephalus microplus]
MAKGTVLWRRTKNPDEDIWDDSDLIAAYDQAYEKVKKEIDRRKPYFVGELVSGARTVDWMETGKKHCIVHYIGYGNEERVLLSDLYPSEGKKARQAQQARAGSTVHTSDETSGSSQRCTGIPDLPSEPPWGAANLGVPFSSSSRGTPPLPAHPPLILDNSAESEALSSMLMAWYMSGYHTGYYQALQQSRQTRK